MTVFTYLEWWVPVAGLVVSFRPIFALALLPLLLIALVLRQRIIAQLAIVLFTINTIDILLYYIPNALLTDQHNVRLLLYNADRNYLPYVGVGDVVTFLEKEQPQIAVLLEIGTEQAAELQAQTEFAHSFAHQDIPTDGFLILSHYPLLSTEVLSIGAGRRAGVVTVQVAEEIVTIIAPHPTNPLWSIEERDGQIAGLAEWVDSAETPLIIAGDLNITPWSARFKAIEKASANVRHTRYGQGLLPTWTAPIPGLKLPIDHILTSGEIRLHQLSLGDDLGSDHRPLIADLLLP